MSAAFIALSGANIGLLPLIAGGDLLAAAGVTISPSDPPKPRSPYAGLPAKYAQPSAVSEEEKARRFSEALQRDADSRWGRGLS